MADDGLEQARAALERGDYGRCQRLLAPLLEEHGVGTTYGAELRLLLATAQMGQGDTAAAAATCRSLRACRDANLRSQARDLQEVLEAPALQRPREWSMTLPSLGEMEPLEGQVRAMARTWPSRGSISPRLGRVIDHSRGRCSAGASSTSCRSRAWLRRLASRQARRLRQVAAAAAVSPWPIWAVASSKRSSAP